MRLANFDIEKLVRYTAYLMRKLSLTDISDIKVTRIPDKSNFWNKLCIKYFGKIKYLESLKISKWWLRNTQNYKHLVFELLKKLVPANSLDQTYNNIYVDLLPDKEHITYQDQMNQEQMNQEQTYQEQMNQEQPYQEQMNQEQMNQEQMNQEQMNQEQMNQEQMNQEQPYQEQPYQEQPYQEQPYQEQMNQEQMNQEQMNQEQPYQEQMNQESLVNEQSLILKIDCLEWNKLKESITNSKRKYFKNVMSAFLSEKLQNDYGIKCWFKSKYNWFKRDCSKKIISPYWNGNFKCIDFRCSNSIRAVIDNDNEFIDKEKIILVKIFYIHKYDHPNRISPKIYCRGNERLEQALHLIIDGAANCQSQNILYNRINPDNARITNKSILHKIKCEYYNRNKISNDIFIDADSAKSVSDAWCVGNFTDLNGYIHDISLNPFGFLLICDKQLEIWNSLSEKNSIWFFDATGSVHKDVKRQKKPFLYSLVMHDQKNKCILPIAEFISTSHDTVTIAKYLSAIKTKLEGNKIKIAKSIVVDMSWALINASMKTLNDCNLMNYLNWCYCIVFNEKEPNLDNVIKTRLFLCSTHFLKNIITRSKKTECTSSIRKSFIYMFTLIQNSTTIEEINFCFINLFNIFNSKFFDSSVAYSLKCLAQCVKKRNLTNLDPDDNQISNQVDFDFFQSQPNIFISVDYEYELKKSSPFQTYFENKIKKYDEMIIQKEIKANDQCLKNEYYNPSLFKILTDYLYIIPLWSGLMIQRQTISYETKSRLTNNPVENWFKQVKHNILSKKRCSTSEIVGAFYKTISSKFFLYYSNLKNSSVEKPEVFFETWKDKKENRRKKNVYFEKRDILNFNTFYNYSFLENVENPDFMKSFYDNSNESKNKGLIKPLKEQTINQFSPLKNANLQVEKNETNSIQEKLFKAKIFENKTAPNQLIEQKIVCDENKKESIEITRSHETKSTSEKKLDQTSDKLPDLVLIDKLRNLEFDEIVDFLKHGFYEEIQIKNYLEIKSQFEVFKSLFKSIIIKIRDIKDYTLYENQLVYNYFKYKLNLDNYLFPVYSSPDGSCLYHSISIILFGNESYSEAIKLASIFLIFENADFFRSLLILEKKNDFSTFIKNVCSKNEWGNEINIVALSLLLNRTIICYNISKKRDINSRIIFTFEQSDFKPILIGLCNNHFFPILTIAKEFKSEKFQKDFYFLQQYKLLNKLIKTYLLNIV